MELELATHFVQLLDAPVKEFVVHEVYPNLEAALAVHKRTHPRDDRKRWRLDETNVHFMQFMDCFMKGASLQDIYAEADVGFAIRERTPTVDEQTKRRRLEDGRRQFLRIAEHTRNLAEPIDAHIGLAGKRVLDFGCGTGALSMALALRGAHVVGVDPTPVSLAAARCRSRYFECEDRFEPVQVGTQPGLPFADRSFDMVTMNSVLEFIPRDRDRYILDFLRLVKPGGHLVVSTENGLFPVDYYTRKALPLFRRASMIGKNLPYGSTYFELLSWIRRSPRTVENLSTRNWFNSIDKLSARKRAAGHTVVAAALSGSNRVLKSGCRAIGIPADVFLPYATYLFRVAD
jgi:2-polyprenyl-3-methyl-5-hydroxy-6-metoxy-1,4-benzoquinol methylase